MFDKIHFQEETYPAPLTNSREIQKRVNRSSSVPGSETMLSDYRFFDQCLFCIDGQSAFCSTRPVTDFAKSHLFFIQSFTIFKAGPLYFTRRQDTSSFLIIYTYKGAGYVEYECQEYHLKEGDGIFIDCRKPHFYKTEGNYWEHSVLHFYGSLSEYIYMEYKSGGKVDFHKSFHDTYQAEMEELIELYDDIVPCRELLLSNKLENLLIHLISHSKQYENDLRKLPENLKYLVKYIDKHYMQPLTLDFLSDFSGISKYYLCHVFKKYMNLSPTEYIIYLRMENARRLLDTTTLPANKIGVMVGISDENYFYRLFKSRTGMPPEAYRKRKAYEL